MLFSHRMHRTQVCVNRSRTLAGTTHSIDKLVAMHEVFVLISRHGINNPSVRDSVKQLLALDNYTPDEDKIDKIISKVRPLITLNTER